MTCIQARTIHVVGDVHGEVSMFNDYLNKKKPEVVILVGDVALYWIKTINYGYNDVASYDLDTKSLDKLKPNGTKIFFLLGNHEMWDEWENKYGRYGKEPIEIKSNVFYCPFGSNIYINDKRCIFVGGATSYDKDHRTLNVDWFKQEEITAEDVETITKMQDNKLDFDFMFSHTCPMEFDVHDKWDAPGKKNDPCRHKLSMLRNIFRPKYYFFGHFHRQRGGICKDTTWQCLNTISPGYEDCGRYALDISNLFEGDK